MRLRFHGGATLVQVPQTAPTTTQSLLKMLCLTTTECTVQLVKY